MHRRSVALALTGTLALGALGAGCAPSPAPPASTRTAAGAADAGGAADPGDTATDNEWDGNTLVDDFAEAVLEATTTAGSYRMEQTVTATGDTETDSATMTITMDVAQNGAMAMTITTDAGDGAPTVTEMRVVDSVVYVRSVETGETFYRADLDDPASPAYGFDGLTENLGDPLGMGEILDMRDSAAVIADQGMTTVNDTEVHEYTLFVDPMELPISAFVDPSVLGIDAGRIAYTYYLGDSSLPVLVQTDIDASAFGASVSISFSRWCEPLVVEAPDPSQVKDFPEPNDKSV